MSSTITTNNILIATNVILFLFVKNKLSWAFTPKVFWENLNGEWPKLLSSAFMHGSVSHLAFNMFALYSFGKVVEPFLKNKIGKFGYITFYILTAIINSYIYALLKSNSDIPTLGASGAIASVIAIYFLLFRDTAAITRVFGYEIIGLLFKNASGINYLAHLIGLGLGWVSFKII